MKIVTVKFLLCLVSFLTGNAASAATVSASDVTFSIDTQASRAPISRFIYGVGITDDFNNKGKSLYRYATSRRFGGDANTSLNWTKNLSNAGNNYRNVSGPMFFMTRLNEISKPGDFARLFIEEAQANNAASILTVPIVPYVAGDDSKDTSITVSAAKETFPHWKINQPKNPTKIPDPAKPDVKGKYVYENEFVRFVESKFSGSRNISRPIMYSLDNEPDLWSETHPLIHPDKPRFDEILKLNIDFAKVIREEAPDALILGPVISGYDASLSLKQAPDSAGKGEFIDYYLDGMKKAEVSYGKRLLNIFDMHYYSEVETSNGMKIGLDSKDPTQLAPSEDLIQARVQAPRSLADLKFIENSWITKDLTHKPINLIPWLRDKIAKHYPGTKIGITEYSFGGTTHISGAIAEADALGIFGREGVFAANYYELVSPGNYVYAAFDSYLNYDGAGSKVGDTSVSSHTSNNETTAIHAMVNQGDNSKLYLIAINKTNRLITSSIVIKHPLKLVGGNVFQLTGKAPKTLPTSPVTMNGDKLNYALPPYSVSTIVLH